MMDNKSRYSVVSSCTGTQKKETLTNYVITPCMVMKTKGIPSCTGTPGQPQIFPMSGDLAIEVAMDIEYRIGRAHRCAKKFLRLRTYFLHKSKGTLTLRGVL